MSDSHSILDRLAQAGGPVPRVRLRGATDERGLARSGRFDILGELARGGVGVVHKGRDVDLGRDVAIKVLHDHYANNTELVQRLIEVGPASDRGGAGRWAASTSGDRAGVRAGTRQGGAAVFRDEARKGRDLGGAPEGVRFATRPARAVRAGLPDDGVCAQPRRRASRHQTEQRHDRFVRRGAGARLGVRQGAAARRCRRRADGEAAGGHAHRNAAFLGRRLAVRRGFGHGTGAPTCSRWARSCARS